MIFFRTLLFGLWVAAGFGGSLHADTFYVSSFADNKVVKIAANGEQTNFASGFGRPYGVAFDAGGFLYVAGSETNRIVRLLPDGTKFPFATLAADGFTALAFNRDGQLFVASQNASSITRVYRSGAAAVFATKLQFPFGLAFDREGSLHVAYSKNGALGRVDKIAADGTVTPVVTNGLSSLPRGLAFDAAGNLFIADYGAGRIRKVTPAGDATTFASGLSAPSGLAFDSAGDLYSVNEGAGSVSRITPDGVVHPFASGLNHPLYIAIEPDAKAATLAVEPPTPADLGVRLRLLGWPLQFYSLEFSNDLAVWQPLADFQLQGEAQYQVRDAGSVGIGARFYRTKTVP